MQKLAKRDRERIRGTQVRGYPDDKVAEDIEIAINNSLPPLPGLQDDLPVEERVKVYDEAITRQLVAFVKTYGDPYGCEDLGIPAKRSRAALVAAR